MDSAPEPLPGTTPDAAALVRVALHDPDFRRARAAMRQMRQPGVTRSAVLDGLADGLRHSDPFVRRRAAQALGGLGAAAGPALAALVAALRDPGWTVREAVVQALVEIPDDAGVVCKELAACALHDRNPLVRAAAGKAAVRRGADPAADFGAAVRHPHASVRRRAVHVLGRFAPGTAGVVPLLREALEDGHAKVRRAAADALGGFGPAAVEGLPRLVRCAFDGDARVRSAAAESVRRLLDEPAALPLRWLAGAGGLIDDPEAAVRAGLDRPDLPERVREEFVAACVRRRRWHARRRASAAAPEGDVPPAPGTAGEAALMAAAAAERADAPDPQRAAAARAAEFAWLLGWLCELWLGLPTGSAMAP